MRTSPSEEEDAPAAFAGRFDGRPAFLETSRASLICTREFEALTADIEERIDALDEEALQAKAEVRRAPGRCIVQLGPVGLTLSWLRDKSGQAADGRLFIVEWDGQVGRGAVRLPERAGADGRAKTAVPIRERVLMPEATTEADWKWRPEGNGTASFRSAELAERCVESLVATLKKRTH